MSDRNKGRKPGQMSNKAKKNSKDQGQRMERGMDHLADEAEQDMSNEMKQKLRHH
ncbi:hypothetical protein GFY24_33975 [Nocardia sp. SYP-A9097]|uniref:hypothetical protein n=1 Tax=Nocardia sp. SYP-A9097 TaxID=2663237 RepID=UPI00129BEA89|nr:hypothetical protein [Nocardia sp. SYP-A9097]MRH92375.1 hypothetical protein [Nocardia sp. SYP-A9097]